MPFQPNRRVREILDELSKNGKLSASDVVEYARPEDSPLHPCFEWDDTAAAEKYRIEQAKQLIRAVVIVEPRSSQTIRAYVSIDEDRGGQIYQRADELIQTAAGRAAMLKTALRELQEFRRKYAHLKELESVFAEVAKLA